MLKNSKNQCKASTRKGNRCKNISKTGGYCLLHSKMVNRKGKKTKLELISLYLSAAKSLVYLIEKIHKFSPEIIDWVKIMVEATSDNERFIISSEITIEEYFHQRKQKPRNLLESFQLEQKFPFFAYTADLKHRLELINSDSNLNKARPEDGFLEKTPKKLQLELKDSCDDFLKINETLLFKLKEEEYLELNSKRS